jgi:two-component system, chemotaxis family, protein-glutamate methylesterase/glutaminase
MNSTPRAPRSDFRAVVTGGSAGGVEALAAILSALPPDFELPVMVVQHLHPSDDGAFARRLARATRLPVIEPCDKQRIEGGRVYAAPANYHMLVERNATIALSVDEKVNWSRPSIDVLFESAALAWGETVIAVILSGANADGAAGARAIKAAGGLTIAQESAAAEHPLMPQAAIDTGAVDEVLRLPEIGQRLLDLGTRKSERGMRARNAGVGTGNAEVGSIVPRSETER